jgi:peptidoglycan/LPS O-acetylase OafA/YrhL
MNKDLFFIVYSLFLPYIIFYIVYVPSGQIRKFNIMGDYSYGIYIYAFPIQQTMAALVPGISVTTMIVYSFGFTLIMSILSWHLIEKRFLKMKGTYIFIENMVRPIITLCITRTK